MKIETSVSIPFSPLPIQNTQPVKAAGDVPKVEAPQIQIPRQGASQESFSEFSHKPKQEMTLEEKDWIALIEKTNKAINGANKTFEYSIHEKTKQIMVKVIDQDTKEVIREIPPEKVLDMVARMWEMAGLFVDERR